MKLNVKIARNKFESGPPHSSADGKSRDLQSGKAILRFAGGLSVLACLAIALPTFSALQDNTTVIDISADENRTRSVAVGDLNGDGAPDLVVANESGERNQVYLNDGFGGFGAASDVDNRQETTDSLDLADVDGDGDLDLVIGNRSSSEDNRLYTNDGSGNFQERNTAVNDSTYTDRQTSTVRFADVNLDGEPDLIVANRNARNVVMLGNPAAGFFGFPTRADLLNSGLTDSSSVAIGDLNGDGAPDLVFGNRRNERNSFYINTGDAVNVPFGQRRELSPDQNYTDWIEIADLNGDGWNDVILANRLQPNLYLINQQTAPVPTFAQSRQISPDADYTRDIRAVDVDGDGDLDIVTANDASSTNKLYLNKFVESGLSAVSFSGAISITGNADESIAIAVCGGSCDLDGDGDTDIIFGNNGAPSGGDGAVNRAYINNNEDPSFVSESVTGAQENDTYTYEIVTADADLGQVLTITAPTLPTWLAGGLTDNGDGTATLTATPALADIGVHNVSLQVSDGDLVATQDFSITVSAAGTNAAPSIDSAVSDPDSFAQTGDGTYAYDIQASDANDAANTLVISGTVVPSWATVTDNGDGTAQLAGQPQQFDIGDHNVTIRVTDPAGRIDEQSYVIAVTDGNDRPVAVDDNILIGQGETTTTLAPAEPHFGVDSVLANDYDVDGDTLVVEPVPVISPANGTLTLNADGTFEYIHTNVGTTADSFRYRVRDGNGRANLGDVDIVIGSNIPPTATDDAANVERGMALVGSSVLANDDDPDGDNANLVATLVSGPANAVGGTFALNADGSFTYTHDGGATITDSFTYTADDPFGAASAEATVTITIDPDATAPTITVDPASVDVAFGSVWDDTAARAGVTATDNIDGDITANVVVGGETVDTNTAGAYMVTYDVSDATGNAAVQMMRTVNVLAAPDTTPPVITLTGPASVTITEGDTYTDQGATAQDDVDGDITANIVVDNPVDANTPGTYTVTYDVSDAAGNAATQVTRTVTVEEDAPPPPPPPQRSGGGSMSLPGLLGMLLLVAVSAHRRRRMTTRT